ADKDRAKNLKVFTGLEKYLVLSSPDSAWWPLAYEKYEKLSKSVALPPLTKEKLRKRFEANILRLLTSIKLADGTTVTLGESVEEALARLGDDKSVKTPVFPGAKILRIHFAERGLDILGKDKVLAVFLSGPKAPRLKIQNAGITGKAMELHVGMSEKEVNGILKDQRADLALRSIDTTKTRYRFYPDLGLAVRFADGRVEELALAQIPRRML